MKMTINKKNIEKPKEKANLAAKGTGTIKFR